MTITKIYMVYTKLTKEKCHVSKRKMDVEILTAWQAIWAHSSDEGFSDINISQIIISPLIFLP